MTWEGYGSGKVILFGEHAVVYAVPGIAAGIDRGARATVRLRDGARCSSLKLGDKTIESTDTSDDLARAFSSLLAIEPASIPLQVEAVAEVPPGGGLGCSAALGVAIARAVEAQLGSQAGEDLEQRVFERGLAWEGVFHGNPSGIDTAAAALGTFLLYERGVGTRALEAPVDVWLAVGYSGSSASTKLMVESIARIKDTNSELFAKFLNGVRAIVDNAKLALDDADEKALGQLMDMNQMLLAGVLLSTEKIEAMCRIARESGALGAKLTGSGGGGSVIALGGMCARGEGGSEAERRARSAAAAWQTAGFNGFATCIKGRTDARGSA